MRSDSSRPPRRHNDHVAPMTTVRHSALVAERGRDWKRLARHVRSRRMELGYATTRQLAEAVDISFRTIGNLERGVAVGPNTLTAVENVLGWTPGSALEVLAGGEPASRPSAPPERAQVDVDDDSLEARIIHASPEEIAESVEWVRERLGPEHGKRYLEALMMIREAAARQATDARRNAG